MNRLIIAFLLLSSCSGQGDSGANQTAPDSAAVESAGLTGLYESGLANRPDQLCLVEEGDGPARFGLVVWGSDLHSCLGAGEAVRDGDKLTLKMAGDSTCAIDAKVSGNMVSLPAAVPEGCAYYCGARARFDARTLTRKGATVADARKAKDLVGDPLC